jgi:hypothetical protein
MLYDRTIMPEISPEGPEKQVQPRLIDFREDNHSSEFNITPSIQIIPDQVGYHHWNTLEEKTKASNVHAEHGIVVTIKGSTILTSEIFEGKGIVDMYGNVDATPSFSPPLFPHGVQPVERILSGFKRIISSDARREARRPEKTILVHSHPNIESVVKSFSLSDFGYFYNHPEISALFMLDPAGVHMLYGLRNEYFGGRKEEVLQSLNALIGQEKQRVKESQDIQDKDDHMRRFIGQKVGRYGIGYYFSKEKAAESGLLTLHRV